MTDLSPTLPWHGKTSILEQIRAWDGKTKLRFEEPENIGAKAARYVPGALDGIVSHHAGKFANETRDVRIKTLIAALFQLKIIDDDTNRRNLYVVYKDTHLLSDADDLSKALVNQSDVMPEDVSPHALWLVRNAVDVEPLKLGIMLAGLSQCAECLEDLIVLARHDEFSLFAAIAAANINSNTVDTLWKMAQSTMGWGKIQIVERLVKYVDNRPDIRAWLLSDGCENHVMDEYLAYICAVSGCMLDALKLPMDDHTLDGCIRIMNALLRGGPARDIDSYEDGAECAILLMNLLETRCNSLYRLRGVGMIKWFVEWPLDLSTDKSAPSNEPSNVDRWIARTERGWTVDFRAELSRKCDQILMQPDRKASVRETYRSGDREAEYMCWRVAPSIGLDLWPEAFEKLKADPLRHHYYAHMLENPSPNRGAAIIKFAEDHVPLSEIATGPSNKRSHEVKSEIFRIMDWVLQYMAKAGVYNEALLTAGLRSPTIRNRGMALKTLRQMEIATIGPQLREDLARNVIDDPDDDLRKQAEELLARLT